MTEGQTADRQTDRQTERLHAVQCGQPASHAPTHHPPHQHTSHTTALLTLIPAHCTGTRIALTVPLVHRRRHCAAVRPRRRRDECSTRPPLPSPPLRHWPHCSHRDVTSCECRGIDNSSSSWTRVQVSRTAAAATAASGSVSRSERSAAFTGVVGLRVSAASGTRMSPAHLVHCSPLCPFALQSSMA